MDLDQGTILCGIKSEKYPNSRCYGIIITASCDIANCKVSKLYYLIGLDAVEWFSTEVGYQQSYAQQINNATSNFAQSAKQHNLNPELLATFSNEDVEAIITSEIPSVRQQESFRKAYNKFCTYCHPDMNTEMRKQAIRADTTCATKYLKQISKGEVNHFYFLPQKAYCENDICCDGLIVDLQEIGVLSLSDAKKIVSPGIDYLLLSDLPTPERIRLTSQFWLESEDDFVLIDNTITSPWREHLMQRFSFGFVRIGLDGATSHDYDELVSKV